MQIIHLVSSLSLLAFASMIAFTLFSKLTLCNVARKLNSCKNAQKYFPVKANGKKALGLFRVHGRSLRGVYGTFSLRMRSSQAYFS